MASTPITLAALATSAVSGLQVTGYRALRIDDSVEHSVVLETSAGTLLVQLPTSPAAEVHHSAKILGQSALTDGVREQLPFSAPRVLGMTRKDDTRAIVSTFLDGAHFDVEDLESDALLIASIAETISAIHQLPLATVLQQGLRTRSTNDARLDAKSIVDRAYRSGLMPETVHRYWNSQLSDLQLWDFQPVVVHGTMVDSNLLVDDDHVTGVLDWAALSIGDPATDFAWLAANSRGVLERTIDLYAQHHSTNAVSGIRARAQFWHELEIAKWLLHGIERRDQSIIDDAVNLFDQLVSHIVATPEEHPAPSNLASAEAAARPGSVPDELSDTASYDMLDEDRHFTEDRDFLTEPVDPLPVDETAPDDEVAADQPDSRESDSDDSAEDPNETGQIERDPEEPTSQ